MSMAEEDYLKLDEDRFEVGYRDIIMERLEADGLVSASQISQEFRNELRYADNGSEPGEVSLKDGQKISEIFRDLKEKNRRAELDQELSLVIGNTDVYARFMDEYEVGRGLDEGDYIVEDEELI